MFINLNYQTITTPNNIRKLHTKHTEFKKL